MSAAAYVGPHPLSLEAKQGAFALLVQANPDAAFATASGDDEEMNSPFSHFIDMLGNDNDTEEPQALTDEQIKSWLHFLMMFYKYRDRISVVDAWKQPLYPLHLAAICPCPVDFFTGVLKTCGKSNAIAMHDNDGCTVLALALRSGYTGEVIPEILQQEPRALRVLDQHAQLYPFMMAACAARDRNPRERNSAMCVPV